MTFDVIREKVARYYSGRFREHGATACGVDWNNEESQELRFHQLAKVLPRGERVSLIDYGCGYGALAAFLAHKRAEVAYVGYDVAAEMIEHARASLAGELGARFTSDEGELIPADYVVASGIFNVKLDESAERWERYVSATIERLATLGRRGFAFNMLTKYSDSDRMRADLYYGDPGFYFDLCKRQHAPHVALLHDYGLWEFTIIARREPAP